MLSNHYRSSHPTFDRFGRTKACSHWYAAPTSSPSLAQQSRHDGHSRGSRCRRDTRDKRRPLHNPFPPPAGGGAEGGGGPAPPSSIWYPRRQDPLSRYESSPCEGEQINQRPPTSAGMTVVSLPMHRVVDLLRRDHLDQRRLTVLGCLDSSLECGIQVLG